MAIIENRVTEIGDVLYIKVEVPVIGLILLTDFIDTTTGETANRLFKKEFTYSRDGINFYPWSILTNENLAAISVDPSDTFIVQYRYTRIGTDSTDDLAFQNITLNGQFQSSSCGSAYSDSIFAQFFSCQSLDVLGWAINVLEKIYKRGIVPTYIERGVDFTQDRDYIDFWRTFTTFFAYIVIYARQFQNFSQVEQLLFDYLTQRGLFICPDQMDMIELTYLKENFYREIGKRGALGMIRPKDDSHQVDGELLRLICKDITDEFIFCLLDNKNQGWSINNSSPLWRGNNSQKFLNKSWEDGEDFTDINLIPTFGNVSLITDNTFTRQVIEVNGTTVNIRNGIGVDYLNFTSSDLNKLITISPYLNYKISFEIRQPVNLNQNITFGILCFDLNKNPIICKNVLDGSSTNLFFQRKKLNKNNTYYSVEGIIYNFNQVTLPLVDGTCNIGFGNDLIFGDQNICYILPFIISDTPSSYSGDGTFYVWNLKMVPYDTEYGTSVVNGCNLIKMWYKNNNVSLTNQQVEDNINYYFKPYSTTLKTTEIGISD